MKSAITITAFNRPEYLSQVVSSILNNDTSGFTTAFVAIEKERAEENDKAAMPLMDRFNCVKIFNKVNKGVRKNPYDVLEEAFKENDFVFYLEDDQLLSPDAFDFIRYYREHFCDNNEFISANLYNYQSNPSADAIVYKSSDFCAIGIGMFKWQWELFFKQHWFDENIRIKHGIDIGGIGGWDWSIRAAMREYNISTLVPALSRSFHIGVNGVHCDVKCWNKMFKNHPYNLKKVERFYYVDFNNSPV